MQLNVTNNWAGLFQKLDKLKQVDQHGQGLVEIAAHDMDFNVRHHLEHQGVGGAPPPLSSMTRYIYSIDGEPDGSGIRNHLVVEPAQRNGKTISAVFGVKAGKPTMVMIVQNDGATIPVTDKMRGFLGITYGIWLRPTTTVIVIPGRGVWEQSWAVTKQNFRRSLRRFFQDVLA